jgi:hypothetical protein
MVQYCSRLEFKKTLARRQHTHHITPTKRPPSKRDYLPTVSRSICFWRVGMALVCTLATPLTPASTPTQATATPPRPQTTSPLHHRYRSPPQPQFHNAARNRHASNRCPRGNQRGAPLDQKDLGGPIRIPHAPQAVLRTVSNVFSLLSLHGAPQLLSSTPTATAPHTPHHTNLRAGWAVPVRLGLPRLCTAWQRERERESGRYTDAVCYVM